MTSSYIKMQLKQIRATLDNAETDIELLQEENKRLRKKLEELTKEVA
jgi:cell division septum initiation protein DivIVA